MSMHLLRKTKRKRSKKKKVSILSDNSTGRGDAVTLPSSPVLMPNSNTTSLVQSVPEESQVSGRDEQTKRFEELISKKQYKEIAELGKKMNDEELLKCLCQVVTSLDHFKGLYEYLKQRNMVPGFLAHGEMVVVKKVIVETDLLETDRFRSSVTVSTMQLPCHSTKTAMNVLQVFLKLHKKDPPGRTSSRFCGWFFCKIPSREGQHATQAIFCSLRRRVQQKASRHFRNYLRNISVEVEMSA